MNTEDCRKDSGQGGTPIYRKGYRLTSEGELVPEEWEETTLDEIAEIIKTPWKPGDEEMKYIGLEHINADDLSINGIGTSAELASNKFRFKVGDILFGKLRPYFRKVFMPKFDGVCSTDIWVARSKAGIDQGYLFYFMANPALIEKSMGANTGTHMPRADWDFLKTTLWNIPPFPEQRAIAAVLSSLDDKIELLREQNKTLEATAQAIFKEWFVDFNFPDEEGKPYKKSGGKMVESELGEIPDGWRVGKIGDVVDIRGGATPSTTNVAFWNGDIAWTSPKDLSNSKDMFLLRTEKTITSDGVRQISSGLLPKGTLLLSSRAPIGYLAISNLEIAINQGYIAFLPDQYFSNSFTFLWLKQNMKTVINASNGSTFLEISKSSFRNIQAVIASEPTLRSFDLIAQPLFANILNNLLQVTILSALRDALLPRLMRGEVRVVNV